MHRYVFSEATGKTYAESSDDEKNAFLHIVKSIYNFLAKQIADSLLDDRTHYQVNLEYVEAVLRLAYESDLSPIDFLGQDHSFDTIMRHTVPRSLYELRAANARARISDIETQIDFVIEAILCTGSDSEDEPNPHSVSSLRERLRPELEKTVPLIVSAMEEFAVTEANRIYGSKAA